MDLLKGEVIAIEELPTHDDFDANNKEGNQVPRRESQFDPDLRNQFRRDLRPVRVSQTGTSFTQNGNEISWQKYKLRVGYGRNICYTQKLCIIPNNTRHDNLVLRQSPLFCTSSRSTEHIQYRHSPISCRGSQYYFWKFFVAPIELVLIGVRVC